MVLQLPQCQAAVQQQHQQRQQQLSDEVDCLLAASEDIEEPQGVTLCCSVLEAHSPSTTWYGLVVLSEGLDRRST
jgi:phosphoglycerate-specific signal transduction histidine kinase